MIWLWAAGIVVIGLAILWLFMAALLWLLVVQIMKD
jgi:hypothetical protein